MAEHIEPATLSPDGEGTNRSKKSALFAAGGILGAIGASSCCIIPFVVFSLGLGGAWLGNLIALAPYQPYFIVFALVCLATGFYFVHGKPKVVCVDTCERPNSRAATKITLWSAAALLTAAIAYPYVASWFIEI